MIRHVVASALVLSAVSLPRVTAAGDSDAEYKNAARALGNGEFGVTLRYRYEQVAEDGFSDDAYASTLRTTLGYRSAGFYRLQAQLQFEDVSNLGLADDHNDTANGVTDRPVVSDPPGTEIHQATLAYHGLPDTRLEIGRREITLDDQRFVGNVAWRQNHQSFDALYVTQESLPRTKLTYAYVDNVNTVRTTDDPIHSHLLNANVDLERYGTAVAYYYYLDFDASARSPFSSASFGVSWTDRFEAGEFELPLRVELAEQREVGQNPNRIDAGYRRLELGASRAGASLTAGYELLEGSPADGQFNTPLATLFKFNGWADKFLVTPADGLQDLYLVGEYGFSRYRALLAFHRFDADSGGDRYGSELDARMVYTAPWDQQFVLSFAIFDGDVGFTDTNKLWIFSEYAF